MKFDLCRAIALERDHYQRSCMYTPCDTQLCTNTPACYPRFVECRWSAASPSYQWIAILLHLLLCLHPLLRMVLLYLVQRLVQLLHLLPQLRCTWFHVGHHPTKARKRSFEAQVPCRCARHGQVCHRKFRSQRRSIPCQRKSPQPQLNPLLGCAARNQTRGGMGVFQQQTKRTRPVVDLPWG